MELSGDEILADGIIFRDKKSPKDRLEVTIGDGMEFTIHGNDEQLIDLNCLWLLLVLLQEIPRQI